VVIAGNTITVDRQVTGSGGTDFCASDSIDLGSLPAGAYQLNWNDGMSAGTRTATYNFFVGRPVSYSEYLQPQEIGVVPPLLPGKPVQLLVNWCTVARSIVVGAPAADVSDGAIRVSQGIVAEPGTSEGCALYLIDLGSLPSRRYDVTLNRRVTVQSNTSDQAAAITFIVQQPAATAPCGGLPLAVTATVNGSVRLHYEDVVRGYEPSFAAPTVVNVGFPWVFNSNVISGQIRVEQPMTDRDDYTRPGSPKPQAVCHAEELDLGVLPAGTYGIEWDYLAALGGSGVYRLVSSNQFVWSGTDVRCSGSPRFASSPDAPVAGGSIRISLIRILRSHFIGSSSFTINGNEITVSSFIDTEIPPFLPTPDDCQTSSVVLGPLPVGEYHIHWQLVDFGVVHDEGTFPLVVSSNARRHAAR
jgi:hypothetical protein